MMSAGNAFRSHLLQQFTNSARSQARPPLVLHNLSTATTTTTRGVTTTTSSNGNSNGNSNASTASIATSDGRRFHHQHPLSSTSNRRNTTTNTHTTNTNTNTNTSTAHRRRQHLHSSSMTTTIESDESNETTANPSSSSSSASFDFRSIIRSRKTTSRFVRRDDTTTDDERALRSNSNSISRAITRAVECAITAPNHYRTEPFTFYRMTYPGPSVERLLDISYNVTLTNGRGGGGGGGDDENGEEMVRRKAERKREKWKDVGGFVVVCVEGQPCQIPTDDTVKHDDDDDDDDRGDEYWYGTLPLVPPQTERQLEDYAAACAAIQNMLLSLHSENYGSKWATGPVVRCRAFRRLIGCGDGDMVAGLVMVGLEKDGGGGGGGGVRRKRRDLVGDFLRDV